MSKVDVDRIVGSIRESAAVVREKTDDAVEDVADKIEDALEKAGAEGRKLQRQVKEELARRWRQVDRVGRENASGWCACSRPAIENTASTASPSPPISATCSPAVAGSGAPSCAIPTTISPAPASRLDPPSTRISVRSAARPMKASPVRSKKAAPAAMIK